MMRLRHQITRKSPLILNTLMLLILVRSFPTPEFDSYTCCLTQPVRAQVSIEPEAISFHGIVENRTFTIKVRIFNVTELFGYEFKITWNTTLLNVTRVRYLPPESWGSNYFVAKNEIDYVQGLYWHAVTAIPPATGFSGNLTVVILTFEVVYIPLYPEVVKSRIELAYVKLSNPAGEPIPCFFSSATYEYYPAQPVVALKPNVIKINCASEVFSVDLNLVNVTSLYGFYAKMVYNNSILRVIDFQFDKILHAPYEIQSVGFNQQSGEIWVEVRSKSPAQPFTGSAATLHILFAFKNILIEAVNSTIRISESSLTTQSGVELQHRREHTLIMYCPLKGDFNSDGEVDVRDLYFIARYYGCHRGDACWNEAMDLNGDGIIDILDMIMLAKLFNG